MATALSLINGAMDVIGTKAVNETLQAADAQDGLRRLNQVVASWRTQFGTILAVQRTIFPLVANQQTYTIGLGGDFDVPRPVTIPAAGLWLNGLSSPATVTGITRSGIVATVTQTSHPFAVGDEAFLDGAVQIGYNGLQTVQTVPTANSYTFTVPANLITPATGTITAAAVNGQPVEIPRTIITDSAYQSIQIKNLSNSQFTVVYYNPTFPMGTIFVWPLPDTAQNQLVLYLQNAFEGFADLTTDYAYPDLPGYAEALEYNLADRLLRPYAVKDQAVIQDIKFMAAQSLGFIKRANNKLVDLPTDATILSWNRRAGYNINTGTDG